MKAARLAALLLAGLLGTTYLGAEEPPLAVGSEGVPVPKKVKDVKPRYPPEAVAQGVRGIVILDVVIDVQGAVESVSVVRSVPGLDDAAVAAASQWRYEPVKVNGRPSRVRLTVPITFALALPKLTRDAGIPELRQGVTPVFPEGAKGGGKASVGVILAPDGHIVARGPGQESEEPWTNALLAAVDTWRFSPTSDDAFISFRIDAKFVAGKRTNDDAVTLRATDLKVADAPSSLPSGAAPAPTPPAPAPPATDRASAGAPPAVAATPAVPAPAAAAPSTPEEPAGATAASAGRPSPSDTIAPAPPPLEVVSAPTPPPAPPAPESGISVVRDVTLEAGVPELAKGRRPVPPPVARMVGATGSVEVTFSVSAAGTTTVQRVTGPDSLKQAAEQAVASWVFRRTRADRAYLVAVFDYGEDRATAVVRPQPAPASGR